MAYQYDGSAIVITQTATADLSASQYELVMCDTANDSSVVVCAAVTDTPLGVLLNKPGAGEAATVLCAGVTKVATGAAVANGALLGVDATGRVVTQAPANVNPVFGQACLSSQPGA